MDNAFYVFGAGAYWRNSGEMGWCVVSFRYTETLEQARKIQKAYAKYFLDKYPERRYRVEIVAREGDSFDKQREVIYTDDWAVSQTIQDVEPVLEFSYSPN